LSKRLDLTGKKFGHWTVLRFDHLHNEESKWLCQCDCGKVKVIYGSSLVKGTSTSCGCGRRLDLTGKTFGKLRVISFHSMDERGGSNWNCKCSCGNSTVAYGPQLNFGLINSCGCLQKEHAKKIGRANSGENNPGWRGGISFEPYCQKFNNELKERVRSYFENRCILCGTHEDDLNSKLCVHHVEYNKRACCDELPVHFATLCRSCHGKTNKERGRWEAMLHRVIDEIYNGRSYYTKEEYTELITCD